MVDKRFVNFFMIVRVFSIKSKSQFDTTRIGKTKISGIGQAFENSN